MEKEGSLSIVWNSLASIRQTHPGHQSRYHQVAPSVSNFLQPQLDPKIRETSESRARSKSPVHPLFSDEPAREASGAG